MNSMMARKHGLSGTALIETAIVMPLYMLLFLGLLYFGYATLGRQRQTVAGTTASWLPGTQRADILLEEYWPWAGAPVAEAAASGSLASAGDTSLWTNERVREGDEYYGNEIPSQIDGSIPELSGSGTRIFNKERVGVSLWTYAFGEVYQDFEWVDGSLVERMRPRWDHVSRYLNSTAPGSTDIGGGFIPAEAGTGPDSSANLPEYSEWISVAFDGLGSPWLERRTTQVTSKYNHPAFAQLAAGDPSRNSSFTQYITGNYGVAEELPESVMQFDLTGRTGVVRGGFGEYDVRAEDLLTHASQFIGEGDSLDDAGSMDSRALWGEEFKDFWLPR